MIRFILKYPNYIGFEITAFAWVKHSLASTGVLLVQTSGCIFSTGNYKKKNHAVYSNSVHVKNCFSQETENPAIVSAFDFSRGSTVPMNDTALNFPAGERVA